MNDFKQIGKGTKILTVAGSTIVNYIDSLGLASDSEGDNVPNNLDKLLAGRSRFMIYQDLALLHDMNSNLDFPVNRFRHAR